jgi:phenylacetate-CoA ligase
MISYLTSNYIFPAYHILLRDGLWPIIKEYERFQWLPIQQLRGLQLKKLKLLLEHCRKNVPYYNGIFRELGVDEGTSLDFDTFLRLPCLTKTVINTNRDQLIARNVKRNDLIPNSTSGSTGEALYFFQDKGATLARQAVVWRNQKWVHCLYTDRQASLWGAPFDIKRRALLKQRFHALLHNTILLSSYELSDQSMINYANVLYKYKPKLLVSYPSPLAAFSEFLIQRNLKIESVKSVITSAESLDDWQRDLIQQAFNCQVYDRYGCREFGSIAHECDRHQGYHINVERLIIEILDEGGNPVQSGESGQIVITDLDNYGFPFLRYKIQDLGTLSNEQCSCGRGLPLLKKLEGRYFDIIVAPNGNRIAGTFWTLALRSIKGVKNFQIEQVGIGSLIIRIIRGEGYSVEAEGKIKDLVQAKCGSEMGIDICYVEDIPLTISGKRTFVVSHLN